MSEGRVSTWDFSHPFLWQRGVLLDLGTLGGGGGVAGAINEAGEIVGWSGEQGDQVTHGFLWRNDVMTDLGTVDGDQCSYTFGINSNTEAIGFSEPICGGEASRAALSENGGPMVDLNALVTPASSLYLANTHAINERGEITGKGLLPNGDERAFLLIPCDDDHQGIEGCDYSMVEAEEVSKNAVTLLRPIPSPSALIKRMMNRSRNPFLQRWRMPGSRGLFRVTATVETR